MRRRRRTCLAPVSSTWASAKAFCRHRRWSVLLTPSSGSVSGGNVRRKSRSMAISKSHRRTEALARSTRLPVASPPVRNCRHSATRSDAGPKAWASSGCSSNVTTPASGSPWPRRGGRHTDRWSSPTTGSDSPRCCTSLTSWASRFAGGELLEAERPYHAAGHP